MVRAIIASASLLLILLLVSCGGEGLFLFPTQTAKELAIQGPEDGAIIVTGQSDQTVPIHLDGSPTTSGHPLVMEVTLLSATGEVLLRDRVENPALNEDISLRIPDLAPGQYRLEVSLLDGTEQIQKRTTTLFAVREKPRISAISSFPPLIVVSSPVLLRAELQLAQGSNPYVRWTWRGKTIARGVVDTGAAEVFWKAPAEEGVYTVSLELFPTAPVGDGDFSFRSPIAMSTDVYVSAVGKESKGDLGPASSYWTLFHLRGTLEDVGVGGRSLTAREAVFIGVPKIVPAGDGFVYRLDGSSGFSVARVALPVEDGRLTPFTISAGLQLERLGEDNRILTVRTEAGLLFLLALDSSGSPVIDLTVPGGTEQHLISGAPPLPLNQRAMVSVSIIPKKAEWELRWFIDGEQVASSKVPVTMPPIKGSGSSTVGGEKGFAGIIDEIGVYYRDEQGRAVPDPTLFAKAARLKHGEQLLLAEGFDGLYLPAGYAAGEKSSLEAGTLVLPAGSSIELPALPASAEFTLSFDLVPASERAGVVRFAWEGSDEAALEFPVAAEVDSLSFSLAGKTVTALTPNGKPVPPLPDDPTGQGALLVRLSNPTDAKSALVISKVLALRSREKE